MNCLTNYSANGIELIVPFIHVPPLVIRRIFSFQNNQKNLDPSYKTDLDLWDCLGRVKLVL